VRPAVIMSMGSARATETPTIRIWNVEIAVTWFRTFGSCIEYPMAALASNPNIEAAADPMEAPIGPVRAKPAIAPSVIRVE
jgi:hypothetical protein